MRFQYTRLLLFLFPIPFFWILLSADWDDAGGPLGQLKNTAMDWRFQLRGPIDSPVKVVYVDVDEPTVVAWGERPWNRKRFAAVAWALFEIGEARTVGYDFIFSSLSATEMVPAENINKSNQAMADLVQNFPRQVVLACSYSGVKSDYMSVRATFPFIYKGHIDPTNNPFPEYPNFPIVNEHWGTVAHINPDLYRNQGAVPRWVPMFAQTTGVEFSYNLALGTKFHFSQSIGALDIVAKEDMISLESEDGISLFSWPSVTEHTIYPMALQLILQYQGLDESNVTRTEEAIQIHDNENNLLYQIPLIEQQIVEVNWFSKWIDSVRNPRVSAVEVRKMAWQYAYAQSDKWNPERFEGKTQAEGLAEAKQFFSLFKDAVVLIGPVDTTLQDLAPTPFDNNEVPKVGLHGNLVKTIASGLYITRLPWWGNVLITLGLTVLITAFGLYSGKRSIFFKALSFGLVVAYVVAVFLLFNEMHLVLPLVTPVGASVSTALVALVYRLISEEQASNRLQGMFGTYLSPELVTQMVDSGEEPQLGGMDANITAFFSDVQNFSTFSEQLTPKQLVDLMNEYLTAMTDILMESGCYVDKYIGDAIVGIFNAPVTLKQHALSACIASQLMQERQAQLREKWKSEGDKWPAVVPNMQTRMGMNTGHATVGNMGSEKRFNYTMMGDTVNLAARCESGAKAYGVYTMVTGECYDAAVAAGDDVIFRYLDKIIVKGRFEPVRVYEVVSLKKNETAETAECLGIYEEATKAYLAQDFAKAITLFEKASRLEPNRKEKNPNSFSTPSHVLLKRCQHYKEAPPSDDWDGVFIMKTK